MKQLFIFILIITLTATVVLGAANDSINVTRSGETLTIEGITSGTVGGNASILIYGEDGELVFMFQNLINTSKRFLFSYTPKIEKTVSLKIFVKCEGDESIKSTAFLYEILEVAPPVEIIPSKESPSSSGGGGTNFSVSTASPIPPVAIQQQNSFYDVKDHWARAAIEEMATAGYVKGIGDGFFEPDKPIKRCEFIVLISRIANLEMTAYKDEFEDVIATDWYANSLQNMVDSGIVSKGKLFRPEDNITREEMAKLVIIAYNLLNGSTPTDDMISFRDKQQISDWAKEYVTDAVSLGIIFGNNNDEFLPKEYTTRAEATVVIKRFRTSGGKQ